MNRINVAQQDRDCNVLFHQGMTGPQNLFAVPLGKDHLLRLRLGFVNHHARNLVRLSQPSFQLLAIQAQVDRFLCDATSHRRLGHGKRFPQQHTRIERLWDQVFWSEFQALDAVGPTHRIGHIFLGQSRQRMGGRQFHFFVDGRRPHVQRSSEDEGETQHVVHLIWIIGPASGQDHVLAAGFRFFVGDFRIRIGHGEHDGAWPH